MKIDFTLPSGAPVVWTTTTTSGTVPPASAQVYVSLSADAPEVRADALRALGMIPADRSRESVEEWLALP